MLQQKKVFCFCLTSSHASSTSVNQFSVCRNLLPPLHSPRSIESDSRWKSDASPTIHSKRNHYHENNSDFFIFFNYQTPASLAIHMCVGDENEWMQSWKKYVIISIWFPSNSLTLSPDEYAHTNSSRWDSHKFFTQNFIFFISSPRHIDSLFFYTVAFTLLPTPSAIDDVGRNAVLQFQLGWQASPPPPHIIKPPFTSSLSHSRSSIVQIMCALIHMPELNEMKTMKRGKMKSWKIKYSRLLLFFYTLCCCRAFPWLWCLVDIYESRSYVCLTVEWLTVRKFVKTLTPWHEKNRWISLLAFLTERKLLRCHWVKSY